MKKQTLPWFKNEILFPCSLKKAVIFPWALAVLLGINICMFNGLGLQAAAKRKVHLFLSH